MSKKVTYNQKMISTDDFTIKLDNEAKLHAFTRLENDERLGDQLEIIRQGKDLRALEPFAKAYLGLFLEIDSTFKPEQRIRFIAGDELANAVMEGFSIVLDREWFASAAEIGKKMAEDDRLEIGYVVLVGMDLLVKQHETAQQAFTKVRRDVLSAALCFNYANSTEFTNSWLDALVEYDRDLVSVTFQQFWLAQMDKGVRYLPGLRDQLKTKDGQQLVGEIILPVLSGWSGYKKKTLNVLLAIALRYANKKKLLPIIETILETEPTLNPRMRIVWLSSAFILDPDAYWQQMLDYTYRSKEKLLPLLDFSIALLDEITLPLDALTKIIRLIAPKFPPHLDDFGQLAANPQKTLRLFYELANRHELIGAEIKWLRTARVMKIVSPILDEVELLNRSKYQNARFPEFNDFLTDLLNSGKLKERRSRFKNKL
ncbi:hypothetical protein JYT31_00760 [Beggiatoa alba]|nr:hypothetical protein [Beggiatoa alba]